ncbi:MAG: hypothetical protein ACYS32_11450 [Planctomycetota bacterium]|jgi:hypothetical protein
MLRKKEKQVFGRVLIMVAIVALALSLSLPGWGELRLPGAPTMAPKPTLKVFGRTYGQLSVQWFQWVAKIPADQNPLFSEGEVDLSIGQKGNVWFLGGSWVGPVVRTGEVPEGKVLFFPIFNVWWAYEPGEEITEDEMRDEIAGAVDAVDFVHCSVDGRASAISTPTVRTQSPAFAYSSEVLGDTELAVSDGYWVMIPPLPVGEHVVHFDGGITDWGWMQDVTYNITVVNDDD